MKISNLIYFSVSLVISVLLLLIGLEYDWILYRQYIVLAKVTDIQSFLEITYRTEYTYDILMWCYANLGLPTDGFLILNGFISYFLLFKALHRILQVNSLLGVIILSAIVVINVPLFVLNANILRQQMAMSILLYFYSRRKYLNGSMAALIHKSAIFLFLIQKRSFVLIMIVILVIFRNYIYTYLTILTHDLYETPSKIFVGALTFYTMTLFNKPLLFNYGLLVLFIVFYTWNITQISSRLVLYGHPVLIAGSYTLIARLPRFLSRGSI